MTRLSYFIGLCFGILFIYPFSIQAQSKKLLKAAETGNIISQYELGIFYISSKKQYNPEKAVKWLTKSAEQGYDLAQYQLGYMYFVSGKYDEATKWTKAAAL